MKIIYFLICVSLLIFVYRETCYSQIQSSDNAESNCITCHKKENSGLYEQWKTSKHGAAGVSCLDCHGANEGEPDGFEHQGALIATLVTPKDCAQCHEAEAEQTMNSYHAQAGEILESADAFLAHVAGGHPAAITGCENCHGNKVKIDPQSPNKLARESWPNSGIGRINPDGSKGSCNACHSRHSFSKELARRPENCGKCHLGPDHPQKEIYEESKHGVAYRMFKDKMKMDQAEWILGKDYYQAPTCATCHLSATINQTITHDVGVRISWTLRPPISIFKENWQSGRDNMKEVCHSCHQKGFVNGHYYQYDALVQLYNNKFAIPATKIYEMVQKKGLLKRKASFSNEFDWQYWELWHHEGRRARMGAAMMGPDYTWWHGIYEVAHNFYFKFIPTAIEIGDDEVNNYIKNLLEADPMHTWLNKNTAELKQAIRSGKLQEVYQNLFNEALK